MDSLSKTLKTKVEVAAKFGAHHLPFVVYFPDAIRENRKSYKARVENTKGVLGQAEFGTWFGLSQPDMSDLERGLRNSKFSPPGTAKETTNQCAVSLIWEISQALQVSFEAIAEPPPLSPEDITPARVRQLQHRLLEIEEVNMLINSKAKTHVRDVYYKTVLLDRSQRRNIETAEPKTVRPSETHVDTLDDLPKSACVILGVAGQGKSTFLRHLVIQEAINAKRLPLFFELREMVKEPVEVAIRRRLNEFGVGSANSDLSAILETGHVALFFDAFDELNEEYRAEFLSELRKLRDAHPKLKIVLSSREDSGILTCDWLHPYAIRPLKRKDIKEIVLKYAKKKDAKQIIARLQKATNEVTRLLDTPLYVVLLIVKFEYSREMPETLIDFYRDLFGALIDRHNKTAKGPKLPFKSKLKPPALEEAFRRICFQIHDEFGGRLPHVGDVQRIAKKVAKKMSFAAKRAPLILDDIMRISNLLVAEGGNCFFVHQSVRDFYAAAFILNDVPESAVRKRYDKMLRDWEKWEETLGFLERIDRRRFLKHFAIPDLRKFAPYSSIDLARTFKVISIEKPMGQSDHSWQTPPLDDHRTQRSDTENQDSGNNSSLRDLRFDIWLSEPECSYFDKYGIWGVGETGDITDLIRIVGEPDAMRLAKAFVACTNGNHEPAFLRRREGWDYSFMLPTINQHIANAGFAAKLRAFEAEAEELEREYSGS